MPKRTREQQDLHNLNRRKLKKEGKKAIVCMKYIEIRYPEIHTEASKLYDSVYVLYPGKRDLLETPEFKFATEGDDKKISMLQPILEIPLMSKTLATTTTPEETTRTDQTQEVPFSFDATNEEIQAMITELRQDPDLVSMFNDFQFPEITVETQLPETTAETTVETGVETQLLETTAETTVETGVETITETSAQISEIDRIIREEFMALGDDLPDIFDDQNELFW